MSIPTTLNRLTQFWLTESSTINPKYNSIGVSVKFTWQWHISRAIHCKMWRTTCLYKLYQYTGMGTTTKTETHSMIVLWILCYHSFRNFNQYISGILRIHLVESISIHFVIEFFLILTASEMKSFFLYYAIPLKSYLDHLMLLVGGVHLLLRSSRLEWCW